jgi:hypothetical protein
MQQPAVTFKEVMAATIISAARDFFFLSSFLSFLLFLPAAIAARKRTTLLSDSCAFFLPLSSAACIACKKHLNILQTLVNVLFMRLSSHHRRRSITFAASIFSARSSSSLTEQTTCPHSCDVTSVSDGSSSSKRATDACLRLPYSCWLGRIHNSCIIYML